MGRTSLIVADRGACLATVRDGHKQGLTGSRANAGQSRVRLWARCEPEKNLALSISARSELPLGGEFIRTVPICFTPRGQSFSLQDWPCQLLPHRSRNAISL